MLDFYINVELFMDDIICMCDDLIEVYGEWLFDFIGKVN